MKKILAVLLVLCCTLSVVSCNLFNKDKSDSETGEGVEKFEKMLLESVPTSSNTVVTHEVNESVITNTFSLVTGTVSGKKAAVYTNTVHTPSEIEDRVLQYLKPKSETVWYLEGYGTSTNKGASWKDSGKDFSPVAGSLAIDLSAKYIKSSSYSKDGANETLDVTMTAENATVALANFLDAKQTINQDVTITITAAAERISSITIKYVIPEHEITVENTDKDSTEDRDPVFLENVTVIIKAEYSYKTDTGDIPITLG